MKTISGIISLVLLILLIRRVFLMKSLAKSNLNETDPDSYSFLSMAHSKAFWWTLVPLIISIIIFFISG